MVIKVHIVTGAFCKTTTTQSKTEQMQYCNVAKLLLNIAATFVCEALA